LLAKQPVYDKKRQLFGYELLFRGVDRLNAVQVGEDLATSEVLVNYFTSMTTEIDHSERPLFINVSSSFVRSEAFLPIGNHQVIIELLERIEITPAFIEAVINWRRQGYQFALDDFDFDSRWDPLLPHVQYIKVDILDADLDQIARQVRRKQRQLKVHWVAERIEDETTFKRCLDMGFDMFQGYFLARPKEILGRSIRAGSLVTTEIIKKASDPDASIQAISELVVRDPKLSMQLLKLINSSLFSLPREVNNIQQAITLLGLNTLKQWALLIAFVADARSTMEASRIVLIRARTLELWVRAQTGSNEQAGSAFLAGLISGVDILLEIEPATFLREVRLDADIANAILHGSGRIGSALALVKDIEYFLLQDFSKARGLDPTLMEYYGQAQNWAAEIFSTLF
jgi:EAL and modified HD-GYP domain-containing signal transduction protein